MEEQKHVHESLTEGKVVEKSKFEKALGLFLAEDANYISESIMDDFIKPRIKQFSKASIWRFREFVADSLVSCIQMVILGKASKRSDYYTSGGYYSGGEYTSGGGRVNYVTYYDGKPQIATTSQPDKDQTGIKLVCISSYGKAEEVLDVLQGFIKRYKHTTVADFYQLVDLTPSRTDYSIGWTDLSSAKIVRYKTDGYIIEFPKPTAI